MITRISPVIIRRRGSDRPASLDATPVLRGKVASVTADPSSLQVFPEVSKEEPMSPYLRMKEDVERLKKKWNLNF